MPRPGLQVVTRYSTSCTHMDRSPLLYVHIGLPVQPTKAAWWPWPFDLESGVRVTCNVGYLCANFSLPRLLCSRVRPNVRDRQTEVRRTDVRQKNRLINKKHSKTTDLGQGRWFLEKFLQSPLSCSGKIPFKNSCIWIAIWISTKTERFVASEWDIPALKNFL